MSLGEVADLFNENYNAEIEFTQYDTDQAYVICFDIDSIEFEMDSMDWLPGAVEVSDSEKVKESEGDSELVYIAVMDYSSGCIKMYEEYFPKGSQNDDIEDWLYENTDYKSTQCYFMFDTEPIEIINA